MNMDTENGNQKTCGKRPILALLDVPWLKAWKARWLNCRNRGGPAGDRNRVVEFAAIVLCAPGLEDLGAEERKFLLDLAKRSVNEVVKQGTTPEIQTNGLSGKLLEPKACFVTLTKAGALRGCIGSLLPQAGLCQSVMENAQGAATRDPRFAPVQPEELDRIEFEISVLTEPRPLEFNSTAELLNKLQPFRDGVILQIGGRKATYLPQVWSRLPAKASSSTAFREKPAVNLPPGAVRAQVSRRASECFGDARN